MAIQVGEVEALFRYPVKSMGGEPVEAAELGWHGLVGDRRLAFRRAEDRGGFPWLTASKLPELLLFTPQRHGGDQTPGGLPTHVRTPEGDELPLFGAELAEEVGRRHGTTVEMTHLDRGIFDDSPVSVISSATVDEVGRLAGHAPDVRRFRPNIVVSTSGSAPFEEDAWEGGVLTFGDGDPSVAAAVAVTHRDERCSMVSFDPDTARVAPEVLKSIVSSRENLAGVYGTVTRCGHIAIGQPIFLEPGAAHPERRWRGREDEGEKKS